MLSPSTLIALAVAAAILLFLPVLGAGFFGDDFILLETLRGRAPCSCTPLDLYRYSTGQARDVASLVENGFFPWWTPSDFRVALFRPLTSATLLLDHALFGLSPSGYHAHSLVWFAALVVAIGLLFRRSAFLGPATALATLLFAVDEAHWLTVSWVANRHALISAVFVVLALAAHVRWSEDDWRPGRYLSVLALTAALLAGESGVQGLCFLVAYQLVEAKGSRGRRALALWPYFALIAAYALTYRGLGYGATAAGAYVDPGELGRFLERGRVIGPAMLAELAFGTEIFYALRTPHPVVFWIVTVSAPSILALLYRQALSRHPEMRRGLWLVLGSLLSVVPPIASQRAPYATSRSLMLASIGAAVVIACVLLHGWHVLVGRVALARATRLLTFASCTVLAGISLLLEPVAIPIIVSRYAQAQHFVAREASSVPIHGADREVVLLTPASFLTGYGPIVSGFARADLPRHWWNVSWAPLPQSVLRTGERSFELEVRGGAMLQHDFEQFYRSSDRPLRAGAVTQTRVMRVEVAAANELGPTRLRVSFDRPLTDASLLFLAWSGDRLKPVVMPAIGGSIDLPTS